MAGSGTIVIQIYTSDARLPLQDASIAVTRHGAEGTELVAFRVSNSRRDDRADPGGDA